MILLSYRLILPMIRVDRLFSNIFNKEWWDSLHYVVYFGKTILWLAEVNVNGWVINRVFLYCSCKPNPRIASWLTFFLYLSQYALFSPLISRPPNNRFQFSSTLSSHLSILPSSVPNSFKLHQHLWSSASVYLFLKGSSEKVGDLYVVSVRIEIA